jgi:uncharacterized protein with HEPN domain
VSLHRDWRLRVQDIIECAEAVEEYTTGLDFESFAGRRMVVDAVTRNLEIMGEAARHVPAEIQARCPEVDWRRMNDMRNVLIHAYTIVDLHLVWGVIQNRVRPTRERLVQLLADESGSPET